MTHNRCLRKQMAQQMFLTLTIETDGFDTHNRNRRETGWRQPAYGFDTHTIQTDVFDPHNRNRWPHNSRATAFCHAWPILLFVVVRPFYPLLMLYTAASGCLIESSYVDHQLYARATQLFISFSTSSFCNSIAQFNSCD